MTRREEINKLYHRQGWKRVVRYMLKHAIASTTLDIYCDTCKDSHQKRISILKDTRQVVFGKWEWEC